MLKQFQLYPLLIFCTMLCSSAITHPAFAASDVQQVLIPFCVDRQCGYMNENGQWAIKPVYDATNPFDADNGAWVKKDGKIGRIDTRGEWIVQPQFQRAESFDANGLSLVQLYGKEGKYGYINTKGELVIKPQFDNANAFAANGLALVQLGSKPGEHGNYGYINTRGEFAIEPELDNAESFGANGLAIAKRGKEYGFINTEGKFVLKPRCYHVENFAANGLALVRMGNHRGPCGYINTQGQFVIEPQFYHAESFMDSGVAHVFTGRDWGLVNAQGEFFKKPISANGLDLEAENGKYSYTDNNGQLTIKPQFQDMWGFGVHGLASVEVGGKNGYINTHGKFVIKPQFESSWSFADNGLAAVKLNGKWGFINTRGQFAIAPQFEHARSFDASGLACVWLNNKCGYIDALGHFVIGPKFYYAGSFDSNGLATIKFDSGDHNVSFVNNFGVFSLPVGYTEFKHPSYKYAWDSSSPQIADANNKRVIKPQANSLTVSEISTIISCMAAIPEDRQWLKDIFFYHAGYGCFRREQDPPITTKTITMYEEVLEATSGLSLEARALSNKQQWELLGQRFLNPDILKWFTENFTQLDSRDKALAQETFNRQWRVAHALVHAHTYVTRYNNFTEHVETYKAMAEKGEDMHQYLGTLKPDSAQGFEDEIEDNWDGFGNAGYDEYSRFRFSAGFWLRRGIDGTAGDAEKLMDMVMREYDSEWYLLHLEANKRP